MPSTIVKREPTSFALPRVSPRGQGSVPAEEAMQNAAAAAAAGQREVEGEIRQLQHDKATLLQQVEEAKEKNQNLKAKVDQMLEKQQEQSAFIISLVWHLAWISARLISIW